MKISMELCRIVIFHTFCVNLYSQFVIVITFLSYLTMGNLQDTIFGRNVAFNKGAAKMVLVKNIENWPFFLTWRRHEFRCGRSPCPARWSYPGRSLPSRTRVLWSPTRSQPTSTHNEMDLSVGGARSHYLLTPVQESINISLENV